MENQTFYNINLNTEIQYLKGVGPKRGAILKSFEISRIKDLLRHFPRKYLDRTNVKKINQIKIGEKVVVVGSVLSSGIKKTKKRNYFQLNISDESGNLSCIWFHGVSWMVDKFNVGDLVAAFGKIEFYKGYRIIHPEFDLIDDNKEALNTGRIIPIYPSNSKLKQAGLDSRGFRKLISLALNKIGHIEDHFDPKFCKSSLSFTINNKLNFVKGWFQASHEITTCLI